jgi:Protein of unknown function (DUF2637)
MQDNSEASSRSIGRIIRAGISRIIGGFLWLVVLVPILGVSAYSLFYIGIRLGVPPYIAIAFSTCFDGVALFAARKSVDYAQAGLSGSLPRFVVRLFALLAAFLQTFHAKLDNEPRGAWILWASLPIGAMLVYEMHIRWEKRKALARAGSIYPSPLPSFGLMTWILFPLSTLNQLRTITLARRGALVTAANVVVADFAREAARTKNTRERIERAEPAAEAEVVAPEVLAEHRERRTAKPTRPATGTWEARRKPDIHIRDWARSQPEFRDRVGERGRIPADIKEAYNSREASGL